MQYEFFGVLFSEFSIDVCHFLVTNYEENSRTYMKIAHRYLQNPETAVYFATPVRIIQAVDVLLIITIKMFDRF